MTYPIPTSDHNEALGGSDTLYSAFMNYEWRRIVLPFIVSGMQQIASTITDETELQTFEGRYAALIEDFYNEETDLIGTYHGFRARRTTNQNVGSPVSTWNTIVFDTIVEQGRDYTPTALPTGDIVVEAGTYLIGWQIAWQSNSNTDAFLRSSRLLVNGATVIARDDSLVVSQQFGQGNVMKYTFNEGDGINLQCFTSVPNLNILGLSDYSAVLWGERIR